MPQQFTNVVAQAVTGCKLCPVAPRPLLASDGAMSLKEQWHRASETRLALIEQAKLWGLRWALRNLKQDDKQYEWMASQVVNGGGASPGRDAVRQFFERVDEAGAAWHPGMRSDAVGRPKELTEAKAKAIAKSAMNMKKRGRLEPCYENMMAQCPSSTWNDSLGQPFHRSTVNEVLTTRCFDVDPSKPWTFRHAPSRKPLTEDQMVERKAWACRLHRANSDPNWYFRNICWMDSCSNVIPGGQRNAAEQVKYGKSKKRRLMSPGAATRSSDIGGRKESQKQCSSGDTRVWFVIALARGVYMAHAFADKEYTGETQELAADSVQAVSRMLTEQFPGNRPRTLFPDKGPGFYHGRWGTVTADFSAAIVRESLQLWAGTNAGRGPRAQPGDVADVLPHETANGWLRTRLDRSAALVPKLWEETPKHFAKRLQECVADVNNGSCDVRALCRSFPKRLVELKKGHGDRLNHWFSSRGLRCEIRSDKPVHGREASSVRIRVVHLPSVAEGWQIGRCTGGAFRWHPRRVPFHCR